MCEQHQRRKRQLSVSRRKYELHHRETCSLLFWAWPNCPLVAVTWSGHRFRLPVARQPLNPVTEAAPLRSECLLAHGSEACSMYPAGARAWHVCNASQERVTGRLHELPSNLPPVSLLQVDVWHRGTAPDDYSGPPTRYTGWVQAGMRLQGQRLRP